MNYFDVAPKDARSLVTPPPLPPHAHTRAHTDSELANTNDGVGWVWCP